MDLANAMEDKCRACLSPDALFSWKVTVGDSMTYADLFFEITKIENNIEQYDLICENCGAFLRETFDFIKNAKVSEKLLKAEVFENYKQSFEESIEIVPFIKSEICKDDAIDSFEDNAFMEVTAEDVCDDNPEDNAFMEFTAEDVCNDNPEDENEIKFEIVDVLEKDLISEDSLSEFKNDPEWKPKPKLNNNGKTVDTPNICEDCGKSFPTAKQLKRHMWIHKPEKILCDVCPRIFSDISSLRKHKKTHVENRKRDHICDICNMTFLSSSALKGHQYTHDTKREKQFQCDQCEKAFFQRGALNVHRRIHTGDLVACEICNKRYPRVVDLEMHMRSHTGERPFKCSTCGKSFKYGSTLYTHVRRVHCGYIYKCNFCSLQFTEKQALLDHKTVHRTTKFKCVLCDKEMMKKYRLKNHIKLRHFIENPDELEELIVSSKEENKIRKMRKFLNIEYKNHVQELEPNVNCLRGRSLRERRKPEK